VKAIAAALFAALILVTGAAAGVPDELVNLVNRVTAVEETNADLEARVAKLERKLRKKQHAPITVCRVIAGQPIPEICR